MRPVARVARLIALLLALVAGPGEVAAQERRIAVTFDDLVWSGSEPLAPAALAHHAALVSALRIAQVRGVGFVNESRLEIDGEVAPARVAMLQDWLDAGWELGNHTWGHVDLHAVGLAVYEDHIRRGERVLRPLLEARGERPRWFRHPYLRAGRSGYEKAALARFLAREGYRIAPVTIDHSDWIWSRAYVVALERGDLALAARLRTGFVPYLVDKLAYYEQQSRALLGYEPPQVLLLHANEINAATFVELVEAIRARGYRFVDLDTAVADPAYARPDGYTGPGGPSWIHRWAIAERRPREFFGDEPAAPAWVLELAGVQSE